MSPICKAKLISFKKTIRYDRKSRISFLCSLDILHHLRSQFSLLLIGKSGNELEKDGFLKEACCQHKASNNGADSGCNRVQVGLKETAFLKQIRVTTDLMEGACLDKNKFNLHWTHEDDLMNLSRF